MNKYYIVSSKRLATTLEFIYGFKYYVMDHNSDKNKKVYSFVNTPELQEAITTIMNLKNN